MNACESRHLITAGAHPGRTGNRAQAWLFAGLIGLAFLLPCQAQTSPKGDDPAPAYAATYRPDEDLLRRQRQPVILPSEPLDSPDAERPLTSGAIGRVTPDQKRLPEGFIIAGRVATIRMDERWPVAVLEPQEGLPDAPPLRLLPNYERGLLEVVMDKSPGPHNFTLTGRVTDFQGSNYLLLEHVTQARPEEPAPETTANDAPPPLDAETIAQHLAGTLPRPPVTADPDALPNDPAAPPEPAEPAAPAQEPTAEDVMQQLLKKRPLKPLVLPDESPDEPAPPPPVANAEPGDRPAPAGTPARQVNIGAESAWQLESMIVSRAGRVLPADDGWIFVFEDQGREPSRPPIHLLPNQLLENALAISGAGTRSMVFIVSGDVTDYHQRQHLLLRKLLIRRDMGNLR